MTAIPVCWYDADPSVGTGQWDLGDLRTMLTSTAPSPLTPYTFADTPITKVDGGAVVILPTQHYVSPEAVDRLRWELGRLDWCVLILAGDECSLMPPDAFAAHPRMVEWRMTPRTDRRYREGTRMIGEGMPPGTSDMLAEVKASRPVGESHDVWFAGQVTHDRRRELVEVMSTHGWPFEGTDGFARGMARAGYLAHLTMSMVAPCPSGVCTQDSFRLYEALEAGAVPVVETRRPEHPLDVDYVGTDYEFWPMMLGPVPFPVVDSWGELNAVAGDVFASWPREANRCGAWWLLRRRTMAAWLAEDLAGFMGDVNWTGMLADDADPSSV